MDNKKRWKEFLVYITVLLALTVVALIGFKAFKRDNTPKYSEIVSYFKDNKVKEYSMDLGSGEMRLILTDGNVVTYIAPNVTWIREDIKPYIENYNNAHANNIMVQDLKPAKNVTWLISLISGFGGPILLLLLGYYFLKKSSSDFMDGNKFFGFNNMKVKNIEQDKRLTSFKDVAGADEEKEDMADIVEFLKDPKKFDDLGARIPKGVLLVGPPGTGKTLLARAVAGEADVPFYPISGSDFVEMYVGMGASRVRELFSQAKKTAPCIIFIDEIDAVGRQRGTGLGGGHDEREQTLNQLLVEMDGFGNNTRVIVIAATNRPDVLDPALMRPGRFDRQVVVNYPDIKGREEILKVHSRGKPLAPDVDLNVIAKSTAGFTGADLENVLNEAALMAVKQGVRALTMKLIEEATIKVVVGTEKRSRVMTEKEKRLTAYHESGHAIVTYFCHTQDQVHQVSIIPRGMAGGYTMSLPSDDKQYRWKKEMKESIIVCMGGRVAEDIIVGDISTGASQDIKEATKIASSMVTKYGMSDVMGPIRYGSENDEVFIGRDMGHVKNYSDSTATKIDDEIYKLLNEAQDKAKQILTENIDKLHKLANYLLENEKINGVEFKKLMKEEDIQPESDEVQE